MKTNLTKQIISLIAIYIFSSFIYAQQKTGSLKGVVKSESGIPVEGALVSDSSKTWMAVTDNAGNFNVSEITPGQYTINVRSLGFENYFTKIIIASGSDTFIDITLKTVSYEMPQITVIEKHAGAMNKIPGSLKTISREDILNVDPVSGNEILRKVPGVHVVDEEGAGLRMNLSIRGTDPDRSRGVLVLEDGIPVALAPYGEPELYYTPCMDRMSGVEVLKGSGSIIFGPQTIGGVVNYITADPPAESTGTLTLKGAPGGYFMMMGSYGDTKEKTGYQFNLLHKQADNFGLLEFDVTDVTAKFKFQLSSKSVVGLKLGFYNENSNSTYVGMTLPMYQSGLSDLTRIAPYDHLKIRRLSFSATHNYYFNHSSGIKTTLYGYTTTRNWQRQDFTYNSIDTNGVSAARPSNYSGVTWGDESIDRGAIYMRNSTGNRNRQFEVAGIESKYYKKYALGKIENEFIIGGRFLFEKAFEQRVNGAKPDAASGVTKELEERTGYGSSAFIHNRFDFSPKFSVTAGMRYENFVYNREILYGEFLIGGIKKLVDTSIVAFSSVHSFIPGAGFNFIPAKNLVVFGGVHRGYAPPRIKDAISQGGLAYNLDAELSWNYEVGTRAVFLKGIGVEGTLFYMDFSNQIIPVSESSGGTGAGLINGGRTEHLGVETGILIEIHSMVEMKEKISISTNATFLKATFSNDRFAGSDLININGNNLPYSPNFLMNSMISFETRFGLSIQGNFTYVGQQYSDVLNTVEMSDDGLVGLIPAYHTFDASMKYHVKKIKTTFSFTGKNITDERYIVSHRPQGIRVGISRYFLFGIRYSFN